MKKFTIFSLVCFLSGFMLIACQRTQGVQASSEGDNYQPRPAITTTIQDSTSKRELKGELARVDTRHKTVAVSLENGIVQTFKFDKNTIVAGLQNQSDASAAKPGKVGNTGVRDLVGKEGSDVIVRWNDQDGAKMATNIEVTETTTAKNTRRNSRH